MIHIIAGIVLLVIGIKIIKATRSNAGPLSPPTQTPESILDRLKQESTDEYLARKLKQLNLPVTPPAKLNFNLYNSVNEDLRNQVELYRMSAEDAIKREERAKAALTAFMVSIGASQQQIDEVLQSIDSPEVQ